MADVSPPRSFRVKVDGTHVGRDVQSFPPKARVY
jgi:hypothetical protein